MTEAELQGKHCFYGDSHGFCWGSSCAHYPGCVGSWTLYEKIEPTTTDGCPIAKEGGCLAANQKKERGL
jgi:hypothetical protein